MQAYIEEDWEGANFVGRPEDGKFQTERKGPAGNVVPFFPTEWKKNANDVFNMILQGREPTEDNYDETTHAAIHKKVPDQHQSESRALKKVVNTSKERPTSGKHYAREHAHAKRKG